MKKYSVEERNGNPGILEILVIKKQQLEPKR